MAWSLKKVRFFPFFCSFSFLQECSYFLILHWCSAHSQTALLGHKIIKNHKRWSFTLSPQWCVVCILNTFLRESDRFYAQPKLSRHLPGLRVMLMSLGETCVLLMVALTSTLTSDCSMNSSAQPLLSRLTGKSQRWLSPAPSRKSYRWKHKVQNGQFALHSKYAGFKIQPCF